jgi:hypothetical protein
MMSMEFLPPAEIQKQRSTWFKQHAKPGMTFEGCIPKAEDLIVMPEFAF